MRGKETEKFRVIRLALLAVMNLLRKRYGMIAVFIITWALPNHNYAKHIITHNLPERAIIVEYFPDPYPSKTFKRGYILGDIVRLNFISVCHPERSRNPSKARIK